MPAEAIFLNRKCALELLFAVRIWRISRYAWADAEPGDAFVRVGGLMTIKSKRTIVFFAEE